MIPAPTTLYSASAGSGKTYTLARDFLTLLFKHPYHDGYRYILAVTFTNKAVAEMKERILEYLNAFTLDAVPPKLQGIYDHIQLQTGFTNAQMQDKATKVRNKLLHDYAAFDIVTLDAFSHRILRTFARDINLPDGFEIEMDTNRILAKAVHKLIARAGSDKQLTDLLISYSLEKIDDGRSWDIEFDLLNIAQLIPLEEHFTYLQNFKEYTLDDFSRFRESVKKHLQNSKKKIQELATPILTYVHNQGLTGDDFHYKAARAYKLLTTCAASTFACNPEAAYVANMDTEPILNKKSEAQHGDYIESLRPQLVELAQVYTHEYGTTLFHLNILKNSVPLSLVHELVKELEKIKEEDRIVPIYEFNGLLQSQVKDQPAPFIYERLGERYRHYFIDEFQDTSAMQWTNLQPLIENALVQERLDGTRGSLMLVGDAKQSIYRWRGSDVSQFLDILNQDTLWGLPTHKEPLPTNYRSADQVVHFNNDFFACYSALLENPVYNDLYTNHLKQKTNDNAGGFVQIDIIKPQENDTDTSYLEHEDDADLNLQTPYPIHVHRLVNQATSLGFKKGDICVLVRKHKQGHEVAQYLNSKDIAVVSGESLLVYTSLRVQLLVDYMHMAQKPQQQKPRYTFLLTCHKLYPQSDLQQFIERHLTLNHAALLKSVFPESTTRLTNVFTQMPLYEAATHAANELGLYDTQDTRLQSFMEFLFSYAAGYDVSLQGFLDYWELKKEKLSIPAVIDSDAVQIMTIHKSKGLEFPVVIVPYCDTKIEDMRSPKTWVPIDANAYAGFSNAFISISKESVTYQTMGAIPFNPDTYDHHRLKSQMDEINNLYVAFTRAAQHLYIVSKEPKKVSDKSILSIITHFIETKKIPRQDYEDYTSASLGNPNIASDTSNIDDKSDTIILEDYKVNIDRARIDVSTRKGLLWASGADALILKGNLVHDYLAQLLHKKDLPAVLKAIAMDHTIDEALKEEITNTITTIVDDAHFGPYFDEKFIVKTEAAILIPGFNKQIPDRILLEGINATIIDYKTGAIDTKHQAQVDAYATTLEEMGYTIIRKSLIYTDQMKEIAWV